jgi:CDP-diacylglycerol---serine O-phosphatidyltransferase
MKNLRFILPNSLTLINLIFGCAAITVALIGENEYNAAWLILIAAVFDVFDGFFAKLLDARSEFGVQLDSLADMVSFGVAPSIVLYRWLLLVLTKRSIFSTFELTTANFAQNVILFCSFFFAVAVAIRLARFNITPSKGKNFKGLPCTSAALIIASIWLILGSTESEFIRAIILNIYFVLLFIAVLIYLMLSKLKMLSLKFEGSGLKSNISQYIIIGISALMILVFRIEGIFLSLLFYLLLSVINNFIGPAEV